MDILIKNVRIIDGSGAPAFLGAVGMERGRLLILRGAEAAPANAAEKLRLRGKGFLRDGYDADVLLLDLEQFTDHATYANGSARCGGINRVFVAGREVSMEVYR